MKYIIVHIAIDTNKLVLGPNMGFLHENPEEMVALQRQKYPNDQFVVFTAVEFFRTSDQYGARL